MEIVNLLRGTERELGGLPALIPASPEGGTTLALFTSSCAILYAEQLKMKAEAEAALTGRAILSLCGGSFSIVNLLGLELTSEPLL